MLALPVDLCLALDTVPAFGLAFAIIIPRRIEQGYGVQEGRLPLRTILATKTFYDITPLQNLHAYNQYRAAHTDFQPTPSSANHSSSTMRHRGPGRADPARFLPPVRRPAGACP